MGEKGRCWWLGGHENVNLDVSEAIYSSLGISTGGGGAQRGASGLNLNHTVQQTKCYK